jgi:hypothetical protein
MEGKARGLHFWSPRAQSMTGSQYPEQDIRFYFWEISSKTTTLKVEKNVKERYMYTKAWDLLGCPESVSKINCSS